MWLLLQNFIDPGFYFVVHSSTVTFIKSHEYTNRHTHSVAEIIGLHSRLVPHPASGGVSANVSQGEGEGRKEEPGSESDVGGTEWSRKREGGRFRLVCPAIQSEPVTLVVSSFPCLLSWGLSSPLLASFLQQLPWTPVGMFALVPLVSFIAHDHDVSAGGSHCPPPRSHPSIVCVFCNSFVSKAGQVAIGTGLQGIRVWFLKNKNIHLNTEITGRKMYLFFIYFIYLISHAFIYVFHYLCLLFKKDLFTYGVYFIYCIAWCYNLKKLCFKEHPTIWDCLCGWEEKMSVWLKIYILI